VLARIESDTSELDAALGEWRKYMLGRGRRVSSVTQFIDLVEAAAVELRWRVIRDVTFTAVTTWIGERVTSGRWAQNTGDKALSAFRSFSKWLYLSERIPRDPLAMAHGTGADDGPGARAATTEEARLMIRFALAHQRRDKRATGNRALYWYALFIAGLRFGELGGDEDHAEPRGWKWGDVKLDAEIPCVRWQPDMHKGRRHTVIPLHPTLARLLGEHKLTVPSGPDDPVFPVVPTRTAWRADRERAGLRDEDDRGRGMSPHSARKWMKTELVRASVQSDVIDYIMRHAVDVGGRYLDLDLRTYYDALLTLPELWPDNFDNLEKNNVEQWTPTPNQPNTSPAKSTDDRPTRSSPIQQQHTPSGRRLASQLDSMSAACAAVASVQSGCGSDQSSKVLSPEVGTFGLNTTLDRKKALADLLRSVATLLETE
jgi:integrase